MLVTPDDTVTQNGISANVIDTVGAGDAFTAAFLVGELRGYPHDQNLRKSCDVAAATCAHPGAVPEARSNTSDHSEISDRGAVT